MMMFRALSLLFLVTPLMAAPGLNHKTLRLGVTSPEGLMQSTQTGETLLLENLQLDGEAKTQSIDLERFEVFANDATIHLHSDKQNVVSQPQKAAYFHGRIRGRDDSLAVLTVEASGKTGGIVQLGDRIWIISDGTGGFKQAIKLKSSVLQQHARSLGLGSEPMSCGLDDLKKTQKLLPLSSQNNALPNEPSLPLSTGQLYKATIAIETDGEFYALFGNAANASQYIANLFAYASSIYERETNTRLTLGQINLWDNASTDPWTFTSTSTGLDAFQSYWEANKKTTSRTTAHFLSGKNIGGGIAYLEGLCNSFSYGLSGSLHGNFSLSNPQPIWDIIVVTHEIGHNFGSEHTHDYQNLGGDSNPVDSCYLGGPNGPYSAGYLPGLGSLTGGTAGAGNGTIMSYCHQLGGGYNNISLTFGQTHTYGIKPYRVSTLMSQYAAQQATNFPSCLSIINTAGATLSVTKSGSGSGIITSNPTGISCGTTCTTSFNANQIVTLTATPGAGSTFSGWSGSGCSGTAPCTVTMDADKTLTATFATNTVTLSLNQTGSGTITGTPGNITCGAACSYSLTAGQTVTLTATPNTGYYFDSWSGACSGSETCSLNMTAAQSVTANFVAIPSGYSALSVTKSGSGSLISSPAGINCSGTCNSLFLQSAKVLVLPTASNGYYFSGWSGACTGTSKCTLAMTSNQSVGATFSANPQGTQTLAVTSTGPGSVTSSPIGLNCGAACSYPFPTGTLVSLVATPDTGQRFVSWGGACSGTGSCALVMGSNQAVTATFSSTGKIYNKILPALNLLLQ